MGLKLYNTKRDFRHTSEPAGKTGSSHGRAPLRFVIQKHDASHLHYDFRLQMQGVLRSWAVPKGLPLRRADRRLAVEVEDHPLEYGGFEGTIAPGNYGAGTVMVWDEGTYQTFGANPIDAFARGKIHFELKGKKLKGEWTLVRMRHPAASKPQWLLLKTGQDIPALPAKAEDRSVLSGRSMEAIAHAKRPHEWVTSRESHPKSTRTRARSARSNKPPLPRQKINRPQPASASRPKRYSGSGSSPAGVSHAVLGLNTLPAASPRFVEPMKAQLVSHLPTGPEWLYEIKFDGVRALAIKSPKQAFLISRSGKPLGPKYPEILQAVENLPFRELVLDGELVAIDPKGRSSFQLLQACQTASEKPPLYYYVFDILQYDGRNLLSLPLWRRKEIAKNVTDTADPLLRFSGNILAQSARLIKAMQARGLEGVVAKKQDSIYEPGRRSGAWAKLKWTNQQEFVIGGYTQPQGSRSHFGAILVGFYQSANLHFAAKVGTGFNQRTLKRLHDKFKTLTSEKCPFINLPEEPSGSRGGLGRAEMRRCTWIRPVLVCQVRFAEWTRDHHLRQPAYLGLREDKKPRAVVRESPAPSQK